MKPSKVKSRLKHAAHDSTPANPALSIPHLRLLSVLRAGLARASMDQMAKSSVRRMDNDPRYTRQTGGAAAERDFTPPWRPAIDIRETDPFELIADAIAVGCPVKVYGVPPSTPEGVDVWGVLVDQTTCVLWRFESREGALGWARKVGLPVVGS